MKSVPSTATATTAPSPPPPPSLSAPATAQEPTSPARASDDHVTASPQLAAPDQSAAVFAARFASLQQDQRALRDAIALDERSHLHIVKSASVSDRRQRECEPSPRRTAAGPRKLTPAEVIQRQEDATREKVLHDERMACLAMKSALTGDKRRRDVRERDAAATAAFITVASPQQHAADARLLQAEYYVGPRAQEQREWTRQQQLLQEQQQQQQRQSVIDRRHHQQPIMFGGTMLSPGRPTSPRCRPEPVVVATRYSSDAVLRASPLRATSATQRRAVAPSVEDYRDHHYSPPQFNDARTTTATSATAPYQGGGRGGDGGSASGSEVYPSASPPRLMPRRTCGRPATSVTAAAWDGASPVAAHRLVSTWRRLLDRCRYHPVMNESDLVRLEWVTLRELVSQLGFRERDDVSDISETWHAKRGGASSGGGGAAAAPERWKRSQRPQSVSPPRTVAPPSGPSSASPIRNQRGAAFGASFIEYNPEEDDGSPGRSSVLVAMAPVTTDSSRIGRGDGGGGAGARQHQADYYGGGARGGAAAGLQSAVAHVEHYYPAMNAIEQLRARAGSLSVSPSPSGSRRRGQR